MYKPPTKLNECRARPQELWGNGPIKRNPFLRNERDVKLVAGASNEMNVAQSAGARLMNLVLRQEQGTQYLN